MTSHQLHTHETPQLTPGVAYVVTYEVTTDTRRAPKLVTRKLRLVETFETGAPVRTYHTFAPLQRGYRVTIAARDLRTAVTL